MQQSLTRLAIFGGAPLFATARPIGQLSAPGVDAFLTGVRAAYDAGSLTGNGPGVRALEARLARYHGTKHCVTVANAGLGLIMLIGQFAAGRSGNVAMPAFSYRGLPHIARWARQLPRFCDVDPHTHTLDTASTAARIDADTTSILGVCNFNDPGDIEGLCRLGAERGIPVFFDSVDALGSVYRRKPLGGNGRAEVFSTHATKLLNGFEGGYVTTDDDDLAESLRWQRETAPPECRPAGAAVDSVVGLHATFNEVHAAMTAASLDEIPAIVARNEARVDAYRRGCAGLPGLTLVPYTGYDRYTYRMAVIDIQDPWPLTRDETVAVLRAEGALIGGYWSPALHRSVHAPPGLPAAHLPVAEALGERLVPLPVGELVSLDDVAKVCDVLHCVSEHGPEIRMRLAEMTR